MGRGIPPAAPILLSERIYKLLFIESHKRTIKRHHLERIEILLRCSSLGGSQSNGHITREMGLAYNTVMSWRRRFAQMYASPSNFEKDFQGQDLSDSALVSKILTFLEDGYRSGAPKTFTLAQEQQIVALACQKPSDFGIEMTTWTHIILAQVAISKKIVETISSRHIGTILKKAGVTTS
jgi:putative transposase